MDLPNAHRLAALTLAALITATGCGEPPSPDSTPTAAVAVSAVQAAFTLLAQDSQGATAVYARLVVEGAGAVCPALEGEGIAAMATTPRVNPDPDLFPITVCEARVGFGQQLTVAGSAITLAAAFPGPRRVLVYGDTGCKSSETCSDPQVWPFPTLATAGAGMSPDLVLHMGDYNYRGTSGTVVIDGQDEKVYDAGDHFEDDPMCSLERPYYSENASGSEAPDSWQTWWLDFFEPAADLLPAAPWVFTRGNHELCSRAGPGWFYLLDAGSNLEGAAYPQGACTDQDDTRPLLTTDLAQLTLAAPYAVDLETLRVAVIDSANACDNFAPETTTSIYQRQLETLATQLTGAVPAWVMTHRPIWGIAYDGRTINQMLEKALSETQGTRWPDAVELSLAGHMHRYQSLTFTGERPPQIIIGDSGVELSTDGPGPCLSQEVDGLPACGTSRAAFGLLALTLGAAGEWTGEVLGPSGNVVASCASVDQPVCTLTDQECPCGG